MKCWKCLARIPHCQYEHGIYPQQKPSPIIGGGGGGGGGETPPKPK